MIRSIDDYKQVLSKIYKQGLEVNNTYELLGEKLSFLLCDTSTVKDIFGISDEFEKEFIESICMFKEKIIGPYITEKYFTLMPGTKLAVDRLKSDCDDSRRAVITFPSEHCFQSIQFLLRDNTVNVVCFMRSCDAINNLPYDVWLCYKLADIFAHYLNEVVEESPYKFHKVTMMFGSLHIYKKDVSNVF